MNRTGIEYLTHTWSPISGCSPISVGCKNCWASRMSRRLAGRAGYDRENPFKVTWHPDRLEQPLRVKRAARIGVCFMGDIFHDDVKTKWIDDIFSVMGECPQHTFFLLTKRPGNIREILRSEHTNLSNVLLGVSVENQATADERIPALFHSGWQGKIWVSAEPLLEYLDDLSEWLPDSDMPRLKSLDWVVCGAETGPRARPMELAWARVVCNQCFHTFTPFFFKSAGRGIETPDDLKVREYPEGATDEK